MCLCLCANEGREETTKDSVCNAHLNFRSCFSRKKGYEDWLRHKADREVNNRLTKVIREGHVQDVTSNNVKVGDIVQVPENEEIPCDLVVMSCEGPDGTCYITTANLDGETNLKKSNSQLFMADQMDGLCVSGLIVTGQGVIAASVMWTR